MKRDLCLGWWHLNPLLKIELGVGADFIAVAFQCLLGTEGGCLI